MQKDNESFIKRVFKIPRITKNLIMEIAKEAIEAKKDILVEITETFEDNQNKIEDNQTS
ncbi:MAG TPA: hypothetical protein VL401_00705 [Alphaproteobacteria bacterium]|jgi:hypothetical protein|nr:hypothetical protein [Alphaproteobacteria bacterium]